MVKKSSTAARVEKRSKWFGVNVGAHQGSILSPFPFTVILDAINKYVKNGLMKKTFTQITWCFLETVWKRKVFAMEESF